MKRKEEYYRSRGIHYVGDRSVKLLITGFIRQQWAVEDTKISDLCTIYYYDLNEWRDRSAAFQYRYLGYDVSSYQSFYNEGMCRNLAAICCGTDIKPEWLTPLKCEWIDEAEEHVDARDY